MNIFFLGIPGSGKGTQTRLLSKRLSLPFVGAGDLLRAEIQEDTDLGRNLKPVLDRGDFPPDEIVAKIFLKKICELEGFVAEGFPRTLKQCELLHTALETANKCIDYIFYLDLPDDVALCRLLSRYMCLKCGATCGPPEDGAVCDFCGASSFGRREDDGEAVIRKRLSEQRKKDAELLTYYRKCDYFYRIDASCLPEEVADQISGVCQ